MKITFKTLGFEASVKCNDGANCSQAIEALERLIGGEEELSDILLNKRIDELVDKKLKEKLGIK